MSAIACETSAPPECWNADDSRVFWFARLELAVNQGNFSAAAEAVEVLRRLGVEVRYRPSMPKGVVS